MDGTMIELSAHEVDQVINYLILERNIERVVVEQVDENKPAQFRFIDRGGGEINFDGIYQKTMERFKNYFLRRVGNLAEFIWDKIVWLVDFGAIEVHSNIYAPYEELEVIPFDSPKVKNVYSELLSIRNLVSIPVPITELRVHVLGNLSSKSRAQLKLFAFTDGKLQCTANFDETHLISIDVNNLTFLTQLTENLKSSDDIYRFLQHLGVFSSENWSDLSKNSEHAIGRILWKLVLVRVSFYSRLVEIRKNGYRKDTHLVKYFQDMEAFDE